MEKIQLLRTALFYIEEHLFADLKTEDIASYCYCSKSSIEKLFRNLNHISVHDYVVRRKMVVAAKILQSEGESTILSLAVSLGYSSNESFSRAFKQVWNCTPSEFAANYRFTELYPKLNPALMEGEIPIMKQVDISELYDLFLERKDCYFICCDIKQLVPINQLSRKAGDLAILESMKRLSDAAGDQDVVFRIGGDEFAILTHSSDLTYAQAIAEKIRAKNGETIIFQDNEIPLTLHISVTKLELHSLKYNELFQKLHTTIVENKNV